VWKPHRLALGMYAGPHHSLRQGCFWPCWLPEGGCAGAAPVAGARVRRAMSVTSGRCAVAVLNVGMR
jgi:hypothetical protein